MVRLIGALGLLLLGLPARPALSQAPVVSGVVIDSASRQPLSGAVVQVFGEGELRGRGLSDAQGEYRIRAAGPIDELRVVRIGFRPQTLRIPAPTTATARVDIQMRRIPAYLDPVRVVAAQCGGRRVRGPSPIALIEQARAGLLTTIVSRDENPARMVRLLYERRATDASGRNVSHSMRVDSAEAARSFSAVHDAEAFVRRGFLDVIDGAQYFYAPDAEVLLADEFAAGYCFRVMPRNRQRPNQVGLGFEPADRRPGRVDVSGTLWIDTVARELRDIEFFYSGLNRYVEQLRPGGTVQFRALPNGIVVIEEWSLALVGIETDSFPTGRDSVMLTQSRLVPSRSGGVLAEAEWRDGTRWKAALPSLSGLARWADGRPAPGVQLALRGTPFQSRTDDTGAFSFTDLVPGRYEVLAIDEELLAIGLAAETDAVVDLGRAGTTEARVTVPSREAELLRRCRESGVRGMTADRTMLLARAFFDDGRPVADATWRIRLLDGDGWTDLTSDGRTGSDGLMLLCEGLTRDADIELTVRTPDGLTSLQRRTLTHGATIVGVVFPRR